MLYKVIMLKLETMTTLINLILFVRDECSSKGGTNEGACADGFGVCCACKLY